MLRSLLKAFVFLILASFGGCTKYDGLRGKFAYTNDQAGIKNFFSIPRTVTDAQTEGWRLTERPQGPMSQLTMYCYSDKIVCALYAASGFVAGLQVAFPVDSIDPALRYERYFTRWSPPAAESEQRGDYWTATQYYVTEESLKSGGPTTENGATLQAGGVWVNDLDGNLIKIPLAENEIKPPYTKQACIPNMGLHYYYNVSKQFDCKKIFLPWFAMTMKGELQGVGFQAFGKRPAVLDGAREWYENVSPDRSAPLFSMPDTSECVMDNHAKYGSLTFHIYFIDKPWKIKCEPGQESLMKL